jgi:small GTP-binding protein
MSQSIKAQPSDTLPWYYEAPHQKIIVVGDSGVGKSQLVNSFACQPFAATHRATVGVAFQSFQTDEQEKWAIWDTPGDERNRGMTRSYYRGAQAIIVAFDLSRRDSFENVKRWFDEVKQYAPNNAAIILAGTKSDLAIPPCVTEKDLQKLFRRYHIDDYVETSAKTNKNIARLFARATVRAQEAKAASSAIQDVKVKNQPDVFDTLATSRRKLNALIVSLENGDFQDKLQTLLNTLDAELKKAPTDKEVQTETHQQIVAAIRMVLVIGDPSTSDARKQEALSTYENHAKNSTWIWERVGRAILDVILAATALLTGQQTQKLNSYYFFKASPVEQARQEVVAAASDKVRPTPDARIHRGKDEHIELAPLATEREVKLTPTRRHSSK